jgi:hypothetical protein
MTIVIVNGHAAVLKNEEVEEFIYMRLYKEWFFYTISLMYLGIYNEKNNKLDTYQLFIVNIT